MFHNKDKVLDSLINKTTLSKVEVALYKIPTKRYAYLHHKSEYPEAATTAVL